MVDEAGDVITYEIVITNDGNVTLTLDIKLQEIAEAAFGERRGALVAIEPSSGGVLAFVSKPGFDPNQAVAIRRGRGAPVNLLEKCL